MRKYISIALFVMLSFMASAQIQIPGTKISFTLPENDWKYLSTNVVDKNTSIYLYSYKNHLVVDEEGDTILPYLSVEVNKNCTGSIYDHVYSRFMIKPFHSIQEYNPVVGKLEAIGYVGAYSDKNDGKNYEFRMVYLKDRSTIVEFRLETTLDTYKDFDELFSQIAQSLSVSQK